MGLFAILARREAIAQTRAASARMDNERVVRKVLAHGAYDGTERGKENEDKKKSSIVSAS